MDADEVAAWRRARRAELIAARLALPAEEHRRASEAVCRRLDVELRRLGTATSYAFYWPLRGEVDVRPVIEPLIAGGGALASLPVVVERNGTLAFHAWRPGDAMGKDAHGIPYPIDGAVIRPDIVLVPLVGFDGGGYRLGYGGGYYDRTLAALLARPRTIGIGFELGRLASIHPQPHDIALDAIVTEHGIWHRGDDGRAAGATAS